MPPIDPNFQEQRARQIENLRNSAELDCLSKQWMNEAGRYNYTYNFDWLGVPIIQFPTDIVGLQELIFLSQPDLIIETGVARGGSVLFSASMLALIDLREMLKHGTVYRAKRKVIGIDIDIRPHTLEALRNEPLARYIDLIEGSSISRSVIEQVKSKSQNFINPLILLDSNHTHEHVLAELESYSELIEVGGFILVYDTSIEYDNPDLWKEREWGPGNSPKSAVSEFLINHPEFELEPQFDDKLKITVFPGGLLKRIY